MRVRSLIDDSSEIDFERPDLSARRAEAPANDAAAGQPFHVVNLSAIGTCQRMRKIACAPAPARHRAPIEAVWIATIRKLPVGGTLLPVVEIAGHVSSNDTEQRNNGATEQRSNGATEQGKHLQTTCSVVPLLRCFVIVVSEKGGVSDG